MYKKNKKYILSTENQPRTINFTEKDFWEKVEKMKRDYQNNSQYKPARLHIYLIKKFLTILRYFLIIPAGLCAAFIAIFVAKITLYYIGLEPQELLSQIYVTWLGLAIFLTAAAFTAPKGRFIVSLSLSLLIALMLSIAYYENFIAVKGSFILKIIHVITTFSVLIMIPYAFYKQSKIDKKIKDNSQKDSRKAELSKLWSQAERKAREQATKLEREKHHQTLKSSEINLSKITKSEQGQKLVDNLNHAVKSNLKTY